MTNSPGWAMQLEGESIDLRDLEAWLSKPFDPWVETRSVEESKVYLLRCRSWESFTDARAVIADAERIVELLYGQALLLQSDAKRVTLGRTWRFDEAGTPMNILVALSGSLNLTLGRMRARISPINNEPPAPSAMQTWFKQSAADDTKADLFRHIARADNWYDIYKTLELARRLLTQRDIDRRLEPAVREEWRRVLQMANCARHAPDLVRYPQPDPPVELAEARQFVLRTLPGLIS